MNLIELEKKIKEHEVIQKFKDGVADGLLHGERDEKQYLLTDPIWDERWTA